MSENKIESLWQRIKKKLGGHDYSDDLQKTELTLREISKLFESRSAVFWALNGAASMTMTFYMRFGQLLILIDYVIIFAISFFIVLCSILAYERGKMPFKGKMVTLASIASDRIYAIAKATAEALADGRLTPEDVAKIIAAVRGGGKQ